MLWFSKSLLVALILLIFHSNIFIFSSSSFVRPKCRPETRTALLNLTTSQSHRDFDSNADCCSWHWVECDWETGHVTSLSLVDLNATITSTSPLFSLIHLEFLSVYNNFYFEIGSDAFDALTRNLTKLIYLNFDGINMSSVPPASLMNLSSSLRYLQISSSQLTGELAQNSFHFPNLVGLDFGENNLRGPIPPWISALPNLDLLYLYYNHFSGELREFKTTSLSTLLLHNNTLQGTIPTTLFQQIDISWLDLSSNNFSGIVEFQDLSNLKNLTDLHLFDNNLLVTNNCTNCTFEKLTSLDLSTCKLTEFPHFLRSSKLLRVLDLSNNQIHGIVPKWLNELKHLEILSLGSNLFFGPLPIFSSNCRVFIASKNQFSGEIPSFIFNITSPSVVLDLSYNHLSGRIPPLIGNVENLFILDLRSNSLSGQIPDSLFVEDSWLFGLNLNRNQLEGKLPRSLVHCRKLQVLDLGNNQFNDTFPDWLDSIPQLQVLVLRANKFHGSIQNPNPFRRNPIFPFQNLRIMDLSQNDFTGVFPTEYFDNFKAMKIDTSHVQFSYVDDGNYYESYYYKQSAGVTVKGVDIELPRIQNILATIDLSSNNFIGEIPELLGNLKSLKGLNLSHNMLIGVMPPSLGNLTNLEWLDLSSNELVGKIPAELADIYGLSTLNLSDNHLEGPIPRGPQFNTFHVESFIGNSDLCGFPLPKSCGRGAAEPPEPRHDQDDHGEESTITFGSIWSIVMMGYASGLVIGISIGYTLLSSKGKLHWLSRRILEEIEYRRAMRKKRRNARRSQKK